MYTLRVCRNALYLSVFVAIYSFGTSSVHAQDNPKATKASGNQAGVSNPQKAKTLSGITVTAQKRIEYLQDVPIAISTFNQRTLHDAGVHNIKDLQILVPDLNVSSTTANASTSARIRGVGTVGDNPGLESSVGIIIDGVERARNGVAFSDLGEIEQIEVLKGPQGTVFGANTSSGVIDIITKHPTFNEEGYADLTVGNYDAAVVDASYNNKINDYAAFRVYAADGTRSGFYNVNVGDGPRTLTNDMDQNYHTLRGQLLITPTNNVDINIIGDYTHRIENCCVAVSVYEAPGPTALVDALAGGQGLISTADPSQRLAFSNYNTQENVTDKGISTEVNWITPWFNNATVTSITSLRKWTSLTGQDLDYSSANIWYKPYGPNDTAERFRTFTQELRFSGSTDRVDWLGGLYFEDEFLRRNDAVALGPAYEPYISIAVLNTIAQEFPAGVVNTANAQNFLSEATGLPYGQSLSGLASLDQWNQSAKTEAAFGNVTFHATDALALTLGGRFTHEQKNEASTFTNPNGALGCSALLPTGGNAAAALAARGVPSQAIAANIPLVIGYTCLPWSNPLFNGLYTQQHLTENEWSGSLKAAYRWNESVMAYVSAARGYKAGGFNLDRQISGTGLPDNSVGILPVNNTMFPGEFVNSYELGTKTSWLGGNLLFDSALFDSKFTNFQLNSFLGTTWNVTSVPHLNTQGIDTNLDWQTSITGLSLQSGVTYLKARYGNDPLANPALYRLPGSVSGFAPKWSATGGITYQWNISNSLKGRFNIDAKYSSSFNTGSDLNPLKEQKAYTLVNARLRIGDEHDRWWVELWAENLTNRVYDQVAFDAPLQTGSIDAFLGPPRTYGVTLHMGF